MNKFPIVFVFSCLLGVPLIAPFVKAEEIGLKINADGNVGIGISNPSEKLDVDGNIQGSGDVLVKGTVQATSLSGSGSGLTDIQAANVSGLNKVVFYANSHHIYQSTPITVSWNALHTYDFTLSYYAADTLNTVSLGSNSSGNKTIQLDQGSVITLIAKNGSTVLAQEQLIISLISPSSSILTEYVKSVIQKNPSDDAGALIIAAVTKYPKLGVLTVDTITKLITSLMKNDIEATAITPALAKFFQVEKFNPVYMEAITKALLDS